MNTQLPTYLTSATWLREQGFAPAPIALGHTYPAGPWNSMQLGYDERAQPDELAAVFTALPPPRGPGMVDNFKATHLVTLNTEVRDDLRAELEEIVARHVGAAKCPVRVSPDGARVYLFSATKCTRFTEKLALLDHSKVSLNYLPECVALAADSAGRPYEWPNGDLFSIRHTDLAALDDDSCDALMADIHELFAKHAPPPPKREPKVSKPIVAPGERITWANDRALDQLRKNGYDVVPVPFGRAAPVSDAWKGNMVSWKFNDPKTPPSKFGVGVVSTGRASSLAAVELSSRSAEIAADLEKLGFADRTAGILAGLSSIITKYAGEAKLPIRRGSNGAHLFLFRNTAGYTPYEFNRLFTSHGPGTTVRVKLIARDACFVVSGDDPAGKPYTWDCDLLATKLDDLPALGHSEASALLRDIEDFEASGAGLLEAARDPAAPPKRTRKAG